MSGSHTFSLTARAEIGSFRFATPAGMLFTKRETKIEPDLRLRKKLKIFVMATVELSVDNTE